MSVAGKVALVTGASQGLGKAFTKILLQNGAKHPSLPKSCIRPYTYTEQWFHNWFNKDYGMSYPVYGKVHKRSLAAYGKRGNQLPPHRLHFLDKQQGILYMHFPTDKTAHTTAFVEPVVVHWLERKIAQQVCMCDVNEEEGKLTLHEFETIFGKDVVMFKKTDVTSHEQMEAAFSLVKEVFGGLDVVINNAGIGGEVYPLWEKVVDVNVKGTISGTMLAMDSMRRDKGGRGGVVINISSMAGLNPNPYSPIYSSTKHAVLGFSKSWALNPDSFNNGVRINVVCPSFVDTNLVLGLNDDICLNVTAAKSLAEKVGMMTPEYVAEGVLELVVDETKNGAILKIGILEGKVYAN